MSVTTTTIFYIYKYHTYIIYALSLFQFTNSYGVHIYNIYVRTIFTIQYISYIFNIFVCSFFSCVLTMFSIYYSIFHKTLSRFSAFLNWISVRFYETGCTSSYKSLYSPRQLSSDFLLAHLTDLSRPLRPPRPIFLSNNLTI